MAEIVFVVPSFAGTERLEYMMKTVRENDPAALSIPWLVVEDPCDRLGVTVAYKDICHEYGLEFHKLPSWSNMHGAAQQAFQLAIDRHDPKWIIYLGDDLAITPQSLSSVLYFLTNNTLETVGLVGIPYWNSHEYRPDEAKSDWFYQDTEWTRSVPRNKHWDGEGWSRVYVNVNGAGFACRASMWQQVGGFAAGTWCLDESISYRCWTQSQYNVVTLPGPPNLHYFGAATMCNPPKHNLNTEEAWIEAIGFNKSECDHQMRAIMDARQEAVEEEMKRANYLLG